MYTALGASYRAAVYIAQTVSAVIIAVHLMQFARFYLWRIAAFWWPLAQTVSGIQGFAAFAFTSGLYVFAAIYLIAYRRRRRELLPICVTLVAFTLSYSAALVVTRFRLPLYPLLEILAAGGLILASQHGLRLARTAKSVGSRSRT